MLVVLEKVCVYEGEEFKHRDKIEEGSWEYYSHRHPNIHFNRTLPNTTDK